MKVREEDAIEIKVGDSQLKELPQRAASRVQHHMLADHTAIHTGASTSLGGNPRAGAESDNLHQTSDIRLQTPDALS